MGHRALIATTRKDGRVEYYYSHWGAMEAYENDCVIPEKGKHEKLSMAKDIKDFVNNHLNFLHHEAVWIDGICYNPIWLEDSRKDVKKWKSDGNGILVKAKNSREYSRVQPLRVWCGV